MPASISSFAPTVALAADIDANFLMVGRRHAGKEAVEFDDGIDWKLTELRTERLPLEHGYAIDYFVVGKSTAREVINSFPPFIVGAWRWDNVFMSSMYKYTNATVMDATFIAPVLHQLSHVEKNHEARRGAQYNDKLAKKYCGDDYFFGTIDFADIILSSAATLNSVELNTDPWHGMARRMFRNGLITTDFLSELYTYSEKKIKEYNAGQVDISFDEHLTLLRDYRTSLKDVKRLG